MNKPDHNQLYHIAEDQGGYFTSAQAREAGFSWERLSNTCKTGKFQRVSRGIYRLAHFPSTPYEDLFVAWLGTGPGSVVSHDSALMVYDITDVLPHEIHIIVPRTSSRRRKGIKLHTNILAERDVTNREGLPITTVARTLADASASGLASEQVKLGIQQAVRRGMVTMKALKDHADRRGGRFKKLLLEYEKEEGQ